MSHQSDLAMQAWGMPVIHPASIADYVPFGLWGWAASRASGAWVGFKAISETVEGAASVATAPLPRFAPAAIDPGPDGLHWRWPDLPGPQIERRLAWKLAAVQAFARANPLDALTVPPPARAC
jgi:indolepyruvate ferredoxin oxidoreductase